MKLGLVACYFNPSNNPHQFYNYNRFVKELGPLADRLVTVALHYDEPEKLLGKHVIHIQGNRDDHSLWQKEALLNIGIRHLPPEYDAVAWLDADLIFHGVDWVQSAEAKLRKGYKAVQLFNLCMYLDSEGCVREQRPSALIKYKQNHPYKKGCFGMAWAARREALEPDLLFDKCITGSGDAFMTEIWLGKVLEREVVSSPGLFLAIKEWASKKYIRPRDVGFIHQTITHLYHGDLKARRYRDRLDMMKSLNFNPALDVEMDSGLLKWTDKNPKLREQVTQWLLSNPYHKEKV